MKLPSPLFRVVLAWLLGIVATIAGGIATAAVCYAAWELTQLRIEVSQLGARLTYWGASVDQRLERIDQQLIQDGHGRSAATRDEPGTEAAAVPAIFSSPRMDNATDYAPRLRRGPG
jgi:hypothetical protein